MPVAELVRVRACCRGGPLRSNQASGDVKVSPSREDPPQAHERFATTA